MRSGVIWKTPESIARPVPGRGCLPICYILELESGSRLRCASIGQQLPEPEPGARFMAPDRTGRAAALDDARVGQSGDGMAGDVDLAAAPQSHGVRHGAFYTVAR